MRVPFSLLLFNQIEKKMYRNFIIILFIIPFIISCGNNKEKPSTKKTTVKKKHIVIPKFSADSAFEYIKNQVDFGPRVPNTEAHALCAEYLYTTLAMYTDTAQIQQFKVRAFDGTVLNGKNIIGSFFPEKKNRVLLCAHWDSRPFADYDADPNHHNTPIDGANDGASGVGVLLELARQISTHKPAIGVDIIFFDAEDYGPPREKQEPTKHSFWALGSQYWAKNPHVVNYYATYGILLDMVGAKDATFFMEGYSLDYAPSVVNHVWNTANKLGYHQYFIFQQLGYIDDDHKYINEIIGIPTIDIIHLDRESSNNTFFEHWHTVNDKIDVIDKHTLKVVGQTLLTVLFEEK